MKGKGYLSPKERRELLKSNTIFINIFQLNIAISLSFCNFHVDPCKCFVCVTFTFCGQVIRCDDFIEKETELKIQ